MNLNDLIDLGVVMSRVELAVIFGLSIGTATLACYWRAMEHEWR